MRHSSADFRSRSAFIVVSVVRPLSDAILTDAVYTPQRSLQPSARRWIARMSTCSRLARGKRIVDWRAWLWAIKKRWKLHSRTLVSGVLLCPAVRAVLKTAMRTPNTIACLIEWSDLHRSMPGRLAVLYRPTLFALITFMHIHDWC